MHACSCAKVIVAFADSELQDTLIKSRLKQYTRNTRTNTFELKVELKSIRAKGFAECIQEMEIGVCSVAAPVHIPELSSVLSIGAIGALKLFTSQFRGELANILIKESSVLSTSFGKSYIDLKAIM
jgi:DNA-binding IclR family transcriptional regulator